LGCELQDLAEDEVAAITAGTVLTNPQEPRTVTNHGTGTARDAHVAADRAARMLSPGTLQILRREEQRDGRMMTSDVGRGEHPPATLVLEHRAVESSDVEQRLHPLPVIRKADRGIQFDHARAAGLRDHEPLSTLAENERV